MRASLLEQGESFPTIYAKSVVPVTFIASGRKFAAERRLAAQKVSFYISNRLSQPCQPTDGTFVLDRYLQLSCSCVIAVHPHYLPVTEFFDAGNYSQLCMRLLHPEGVSRKVENTRLISDL